MRLVILKVLWNISIKKIPVRDCRTGHILQQASKYLQILTRQRLHWDTYFTEGTEKCLSSRFYHFVLFIKLLLIKYNDPAQLIFFRSRTRPTRYSPLPKIIHCFHHRFSRTVVMRELEENSLQSLIKPQ